MRALWGYAGPILIAAGSFLAAPDPHPLFSNTVALGLAAAAGVIGLLAVQMGSELGVGLAILVGLSATVPPIVPMAWGGPLVTVLGAALALEGAASRESGIPMAPLRAWAMPVGMVLVALLVALAAFATDVGRESLDITQGVGVAVTAPFLIGAGWAVLRAIQQRTDEEGSILVPATLALVLLAGALVVVDAPEADARHAAFDPACSNTGTFHFNGFASVSGCNPPLVLLVREDGADEVTEESYTLRSGQMVLLDPGFDTEAIINLTILGSEIEFPRVTADDTRCADVVLGLDRALAPWTEDTVLANAPNGTDLEKATQTTAECTTGTDYTFDPTEHLDGWSDGAPVDGWRLRILEARSWNSSFSPTSFNFTLRLNPPQIEETSTIPPRHDRDPIMAPVGENLQVDALVNDTKGGVRNASLVLEGSTVLNQSIAQNDGGLLDVNLTFNVTPAASNGTLDLSVQDWDGNVDRVEVGEIRPDRTPPGLEPAEDSDLERTDGTLEIPDPVPEGSDRTVRLTVTDDACRFVDDCVEVAILNETGDTVARKTGSGTLELGLPTNETGDHRFTIRAVDAALRVNETALVYRVSEPRSPQIQGLTITDAFGRERTQEAGLPLEVDLTVRDESAPVTVRAKSAGTELANRTLDATPHTLTLRPVIETPGTRTLTVEVVDRWGNLERRIRALDILPKRAPVIEMPGERAIASQALLTATVTDASVGTDATSAQVLRSGSELSSASIDKELTETGVDVTVELPPMLHGEDVRVLVSATDGLGRFATASSDHTTDTLAPQITATPTRGARAGTVVWTVPDAFLNVTAQDPDSGVATLDLVSPDPRELDPAGEALPVDGLAGRTIRIEATDAVGNQANWTGQIRLDETAPRLALDIDGHDAVVTVRENESGLSRVRLLVDGDPLSLPRVPGTHRATIPDVVRGDTVEVFLSARDRVLHKTNLSRTLTVEDAPPEIRLSAPADRDVSLFTSDADGDEVTTRAEAVHAVNGTRRTLVASANGTFKLPAWRGDVTLVVDASAHNATTTQRRTYTLGQGPFLHAQVPGQVEPGSEVTAAVTWERDFERVQLVVSNEGRQVAVANVTETAPGEGQATFSVDDEGTYDLQLTGEHSSGTVQTASAGQVEVDAGPSGVFLMIGILLIVAVIGLVLLERYREEDEVEPRERVQEGPRRAS